MAGHYTYAQFKALLKAEMGEADQFESHSVMGDLYGEYVNVAYMTLTTRDMFWGKKVKLEFPELDGEDATQSTIDGRNYITFPSRGLYVEGIWNRTDDVPLKGISHKKYRGYTGRTDTTKESAPTQYARRGSRIYLYPQPDDEYAMTIYYRKKITRLDGSTYNYTEIGDEWDEPLLRLAVVQTLLKFKRYDEVKHHKEEFYELVGGLVSIYANEKKDWENQLTVSGRNISDYK